MKGSVPIFDNADQRVRNRLWNQRVKFLKGSRLFIWEVDATQRKEQES